VPEPFGDLAELGDEHGIASEVNGVGAGSKHVGDLVDGVLGRRGRDSEHRYDPGESRDSTSNPCSLVEGRSAGRRFEFAVHRRIQCLGEINLS
jgi:hypothetical protein